MFHIFKDQVNEAGILSRSVVIWVGVCSYFQELYNVRMRALVFQKQDFSKRIGRYTPLSVMLHYTKRGRGLVLTTRGFRFCFMSHKSLLAKKNWADSPPSPPPFYDKNNCRVGICSRQKAVETTNSKTTPKRKPRPKRGGLSRKQQKAKAQEDKNKKSNSPCPRKGGPSSRPRSRR